MRREPRSVAGGRVNAPGHPGTLLGRAASSILAILFITLAFSPVFAARGGKAGIAPDLAQSMEKDSPSNIVPLVISLQGADPDFVAGRVKELGGVVRKYFRHVDHMLVE